MNFVFYKIIIQVTDVLGPQGALALVEELSSQARTDVEKELRGETSAMAEALESASMSMHEVTEKLEWEIVKTRSERDAALREVSELKLEKSVESTNVGSKESSSEEISLVQAELTASEDMVKALRQRAQDAEESAEANVLEKQIGEQNFRVFSEMRGKFLYYDPKK